MVTERLIITVHRLNPHNTQPITALTIALAAAIVIHSYILLHRAHGIRVAVGEKEEGVVEELLLVGVERCFRTSGTCSQAVGITRVKVRVRVRVEVSVRVSVRVKLKVRVGVL